MRPPYMEDPYTELAGAIIRLREEIVEMHDILIRTNERLLLLTQIVKELLQNE